jgi:excinuclease ABC subunit B
MRFKLTTQLKPAGDQPNSIKSIVENFNNGIRNQVLLGATGTGKTFVVANVIEKMNMNTIIIVHNKTLAAQLYGELKELFKENNVEYFVSYFDFFQPEAYIPRNNMYIEKNAQANEEIEMLRLSTINSLANDKPTIVVASVAAIYASSSPEDFERYRIIVKKGNKHVIKNFLYDLVRIQYQHNAIELKPGTFRQKGDIIEIAPGDSDQYIIRISFFGNEIEEIATTNALTGEVINKFDIYVIAPANEYVMNRDNMDKSFKRIKDELIERVKYFKNNNKLLEAQRIEERTNHDIESMKELGYCSGIENYASHLELRKANSTPYTLFDYLANKKD